MFVVVLAVLFVVVGALLQLKLLEKFIHLSLSRVR